MTEPTYAYKTWKFYVATFLITYSLWFAGAYFSFQENKQLYLALALAGLATPFCVSLVMILTSGNSSLKRDFANRLINLKRINVRMLPAFLLMPLSVLISIALSLLVGEDTGQFQLSENFTFSYGFVPVLLILVLAASFEELGWRGYAFDSLRSRFNYLYSTVIFGALWSTWHFPLIFVKDSYQYNIFHENIWFGVNFFVGIIPMGIIISWVCSKNRGSVIVAILFHLVINISQEILEITQVTKCIQTGVLTLFVVIIVACDRNLFAAPAKSTDEAHSE